MSMKQKPYSSTEEALAATSDFYRKEDGFGYTEDFVDKWLTKYVKIPNFGNVLDLCCGDGVWSRGFKNLNGRLDIYGIDISEGGINKARTLVNSHPGRFVVGDVEKKCHSRIIFLN